MKKNQSLSSLAAKIDWLYQNKILWEDMNVSVGTKLHRQIVFMMKKAGLISLKTNTNTVNLVKYIAILEGLYQHVGYKSPYINEAKIKKMSYQKKYSILKKIGMQKSNEYLNKKLEEKIEKQRLKRERIKQAIEESKVEMI